MPLEIVRNDITAMQTDAIVNAANASLQMGGGVCGAIFKAAGEAALRKECDAIGGCETGKAVMTGGYALPATHIIHAVGPVWRGGSFGEESLLRDCYTNSLQLAQQAGLESIAFPLISTGIFRYPKDEALRVATSAISDFLLRHEMSVYLVVYDRQSYKIGSTRYQAIEQFIDDYYVDARTSYRRRELELSESTVYDEEIRLPASSASAPPLPAEAAKSLNDVINRLDESFSQMLLRLIDEKGKSDVETYKRANMDRKLFSKIRSNAGYNPSKPTAVALAIALELNLDETKELLEKAGYALSRSRKFDVIIEYFIEHRNYNVFEINEALFAFEQPLLGA